MILSRSKGYIFIHIPKTGGSAWSKMLGEDITWQDLIVGATQVGEIFNSSWAPHFGITKHISVTQLANKIGVDELNKYRIFSVVRNPINRFMSSYNFVRTLNQRGTPWAANLLKKHEINTINSIDDLLASRLWNGCKDLALNKADEFQKFFVPQHLFLDCDFSDAIQLEWFKLEEFEAAKCRLVNLGILSKNSMLSSTNESIKFSSVSDINETQRQEIAARYVNDLVRFNYGVA